MNSINNVIEQFEKEIEDLSKPTDFDQLFIKSTNSWIASRISDVQYSELASTIESEHEIHNMTNRQFVYEAIDLGYFLDEANLTESEKSRQKLVNWYNSL